MDINRRDFLKITGAGAMGIALSSMPFSLRAMELRKWGEDYSYLSVHDRIPFPYTGLSGEGGIAFVQGDRVVKLEANPHHVSSQGLLSPAETVSYLKLYDPDRIVHPLKRFGKRGEGAWLKISWQQAIAEIGNKLSATLDAGQAEAIGLSYERDFSGGSLSRFLHTLGSARHIVHEEWNDPNRARAFQELWGENSMLPDVKRSKFVLNFGANPMETDHHLAHDLVDGMVENKAKLITFDVRLSNTAARSDAWHPILPGTDSAVALAMARTIMHHRLADYGFIKRQTNINAKKLAQHLDRYTPAWAESVSGVAAQTIENLAWEFARSRPACVIIGGGVSHHQFGAEQVRACMLLPIITGNIEVRGGNCLPRRVELGQPQPVPAAPPPAKNAFDAGKDRLAMLFNYRANPAFANPSPDRWRRLLQDEGRVGTIVDFGPYLTETAIFADYILPDTLALERFDPVASEDSFWPWLSIRQPVISPVGKSRDLREILTDIINHVDPDGKRKMKSYWSFGDGEAWTWACLEASEFAKDSNEAAAKLKKFGVWPVYGRLDPVRHEMTSFHTGRDLEPYYELDRKLEVKRSGKSEVSWPDWFPPTPEPANPRDGTLTLSVYRWNAHHRPGTANNKYLQELFHSNPAWINKATARALGIRDGGLIRITSSIGTLVTKARATEAIHPNVVAMAQGFGHTAGGRVAQAKPREAAPKGNLYRDRDIENNLWWDDTGVNPCEIIPDAHDARGGGYAWSDTRIKVMKAQSGDRYGMIIRHSNA